MKKLFFILSLIFIISACEGDNEAPAAPEMKVPRDSIQNYKGNFIAAGNAAVLKGDKFIYQVKMDSTALLLRDSLKNYKAKNQGVIPLEVKGKVSDNLRAVGYSQLIEITEIVRIDAPLKPSKEKEQK